MRRGAFPLPGHFPSPSHQLVFDHWQPAHLVRHSKHNSVKPQKELHRGNKNFLSLTQFFSPCDLVMTQLQVRHLQQELHSHRGLEMGSESYEGTSLSRKSKMLLVLWPNVKHRPQIQMNYCIFILMSYRITEWVRLEGTTVI